MHTRPSEHHILRDAVFVKTGEMRVDDLLGQHDDKGIAADLTAAPRDFAVQIENNSVGGGAPLRKPGLPWKASAGVVRIRVPFAVSLTAHPSDQPGIDAELVAQALERLMAARTFRPPTARPCTAIDARHRVADHIRFHIVRTGRISTGSPSPHPYLRAALAATSSQSS
jgi:hypothetical protein